MGAVRGEIEQIVISSFVGAFSKSGLPAEKVSRLIGSLGSDKKYSQTDFGASGFETYEDDQVCVLFSGHLANMRELAGNDSASAPVAVAEAFRDGGEWHVRLWGEYVCAVFDKSSQRLYLLRDRIGFYPLFYARVGDALLFSTEIRHLYNWPGFSPRPCTALVARFLGTHYRHVEGDRRETAFADVKKVPPGCLLTVGPEGTREESYWDAGTVPRSTTFESEEAAAESLRELLEDAVHRRLGPSEECGFSLSSGMDSSSIFAFASSKLESPISFTTSFVGWGEDEAVDVEETAEHFGRWHPIRIETIPNFLAAAEELHAVHDEPVVTVTWLWDYYMQKAASEAGVKVFYGGLGGDELFAGEFEHFFFRFADLNEGGRSEELKHEIKEWVRLHDHPVHKKNRGAAEDIWKRMCAGDGNVKTDPVRFSRYLDVLSQDWRAAAGGPPVLENSWPTYLQNRLWQDLRSETTLPCLRAAVNNAKAFGMEMRYPFLDHRVVEETFPLPGEWKIRDGITKRVLRRAMRGVLPDAVVDRARKMGWSSPADQMFRGPALAKLNSLLLSDEWATKELYDETVLQRMIDEHKNETADHSMFLWQFAAVEAWWRRWFG